MSDLIVTKRFFAYEFIIRTRRPVRDNIARLETYLADQTRPKGFFISDPRLTGQVFGSTFSLQPYDAALWGTQVPEIEGSVVPNDEGSDVLVRVGHSTVSRWLWLPLAALVGISLYTASVGWEAFALTVVLSVVALGLLTVPVLVHGSSAAQTLRHVFRP